MNSDVMSCFFHMELDILRRQRVRKIVLMKEVMLFKEIFAMQLPNS